MASYLAMMAVGEFDVRAYRERGIDYWDAVDPRLYEPVAARTGDRFAYSQSGDLAYKRLARTITVPDGGGALSFWVTRDTEPTWDFFLVEAHPVGSDDWTTLPDANGHTSQSTGCVPVLARAASVPRALPDGHGRRLRAGGTTGEWHAASGPSGGYEQWRIDLSEYAGQEIEISLTYASDDIVALPGVWVDDIETPGGDGSIVRGRWESDGRLDGPRRA